MSNKLSDNKKLYSLIAVAALGYFVDIYDLIVFNVVKNESLKAIGISGEALKNSEIYLFNVQMTGMLLGGILWGVLGDKKGRISVLFGSIFLYSFANIANAFVSTIDGYAMWRFIAGLGLWNNDYSNIWCFRSCSCWLSGQKLWMANHIYYWWMHGISPTIIESWSF
jgi:MFS family permease